MIQQFYPQTFHNYKYELNKDFHFAAAHYIPHQDAGKCQNVHGHTYFLNVTIVGNELNDSGFLVDFKKLKDMVHKKYDHALLNEFHEFQEYNYPSTEKVAEVVFKTIQENLNKEKNHPKCIQVMVRETPTSYVIFRAREGVSNE